HDTVGALSSISAQAQDATSRAIMQQHLEPTLGPTFSGMVTDFMHLPKGVQMVMAGALLAGVGGLIGGWGGGLIGGGLGAAAMYFMPEIAKLLGMDKDTMLRQDYQHQMQGAPASSSDLMPQNLVG